MRLGVLDVGSNTVHFLVVDAHQGGRPTPVFSHKAELRLSEHLVNGNRLSKGGEAQLRGFVVAALQIAQPSESTFTRLVLSASQPTGMAMKQ